MLPERCDHRIGKNRQPIFTEHSAIESVAIVLLARYELRRQSVQIVDRHIVTEKALGVSLIPVVNETTSIVLGVR
jgi:hypothetical protein